MARTEEQFKQIRDQRCEEISAAALKIFAKRGFYGAKVSDITSSINLSHGLLYHYFKSKEDIYISLIENILELFEGSVKEAHKQDGKAYDKLMWFTELTFAGSSEVALDRQIIFIEAMQADFLPPDLKASLLQQHTRSLQVLANIIEEGQQDGVFIAGDSMELAVYYLSISQGLITWNAKGIHPITVSATSVIRPLLATF